MPDNASTHSPPPMIDTTAEIWRFQSPIAYTQFAPLYTFRYRHANISHSGCTHRASALCSSENKYTRARARARAIGCKMYSDISIASNDNDTLRHLERKRFYPRNTPSSLFSEREREARINKQCKSKEPNIHVIRRYNNTLYPRINMHQIDVI